MNVVEITHLTKDYRTGFWFHKRRRALEDLSLTVQAGEIFGFLGPNGAGKTTTLKILMGLIRPTAGKARILGCPIDHVQMHQEIGFLPENPYFYEYLTGREYLIYTAELFGRGRAAAQSRAVELMEMVRLEESLKIPLRKFSKGMIQRIGIAQALINDPRIVFLDEPMSGLDPVGRREVRDIIMNLRARGVTVFFSSHILADVESLCDRVAILNRGRLLDIGRLTEILRMEVSALEVMAKDVQAVTLERLQQLGGQTHAIGDRLHITLPDDRSLLEVIMTVQEGGGKVISVNPVRESLEEFFLKRIDAQYVSSHQYAQAGSEISR
ncbi:MAG: ABC transporter ATP-binding protein [Acidobacteria bacterium]|nr:ABC transporter ATP-binding protein [Acidobacteriota bacterium]MBI3656494.1 ABC transporter ATP-binding protein [Acidobacteriota bacterium]